MEREIEFVNSRDFWLVIGNRLAMRDSGLREYVELPEDAKRIFAVFTKGHHPQGYSFDEYGCLFDSFGRRIHLATSRTELRRAHRAGYRYVHIEYEVSE